MTQWQGFVKNQLRLQGAGLDGPKLVCIDLQPYTTSQAPDRRDILNIGGFGDAAFGVVASFLAGDAGRFVAGWLTAGIEPSWLPSRRADRSLR
jgi:60 kDa SS-A/Ro ribonucleoprotein